MRYQWRIIAFLLALMVAGSMSMIPNHVYIDPDVSDLGLQEGADQILRCKAKVRDTTDVQLYWTYGSRKRMKQSVTQIIEENKEDNSWTYQTELSIKDFAAQNQGNYRCKLFIGWSYSSQRNIQIFLSSGSKDDPPLHYPASRPTPPRPKTRDAASLTAWSHWQDRNRGIRVDTVKERQREKISDPSNVYFVAIAPGIALVMAVVGIVGFLIYHKQSQSSTCWSEPDYSDTALYAQPDEVCPVHGHVDPVRLHQYYNSRQSKETLCP